MSDCPNFNTFVKYILSFDQNIAIKEEEANKLRYNVWKTTPAQIKKLFTTGNTSVLPTENNSRYIATKIANALLRIDESSESADDFKKEIIEDSNNIELTIALQELMESIKGESDKARNNSIEVSKVTADGILPALPMSRIAASIGRKIAYQKGYRFKSQEENPSTAAEIEQLYLSVGKKALKELKKKGYVNIHDNLDIIKDYLTEAEFKQQRRKRNQTQELITKAPAVSINTEKLGIKAGTEEANYFLNRTLADIDNTKLGVVADILRATNYITQPSNLTLPDTEVRLNDENLAALDLFKLDEKTSKARKKIYENPVYVHSAMHDFLTLLNQEVDKTGKSASKIISEKVKRSKGAVASLFGIKVSDDYSIDKKESISGQNLSKTVPLDDLADIYTLLTDSEGQRMPLHMHMRNGRNERLYYDNSVLNPHGSKQSRYMLTSGEQTIEHGSDDFKYLVKNVGDFLDKNLSYDDIVNGTNQRLELALALYDGFASATTLKDKLIKLRSMPRHFPNTDYATLITALQAIKDIRTPINGNIKTEFNVSADATASGGTLTFLQALGTDPEVNAFMERIGLFNTSKSFNEPPLDDLYGLMSEGVQEHIKVNKDATTELLQNTLNMLFGVDENPDNIRDFSKDPTMTFVYGQGRAGAIQTMSRKLADRIINNLGDPKVREYLSIILDNEKYKKVGTQELNDTRGLYKDIVDALVAKELPGELYDIMDVAITEKYLENFKDRSKAVFNLLKKLPPTLKVKVLPAAAVMTGKKASNPDELATYGMPLTKLYEVASKVNGDTVLTRKEKMMKTVMDVSTIHGIDAAQLYMSLAKLMKDRGVVVVHDDVRGDVKTVRAMEKEYAAITQEIMSKYDIHQQVMESIAHYSPEIAQSEEYKKLKTQIDNEVKSKEALLKERFNSGTNALIGEGDTFKTFAENKNSTKPDNSTSTPDLTNIKKDSVEKVADKQDFGDTTVEIKEGDVAVNVNAQEYWDDINNRLDAIEKLKKCLS